MDTDFRRSAAVLLLLFEKDGETHMVLTRRTETVATHKGQISLPGGTREPWDISLRDTALRETQEELGIAPERVQILGELEPVPTATSNFHITPFVGRLDAPPSYLPDPHEVAEVIEAPLSALRDPEVLLEEEVDSSRGRLRVYGFRLGKHFIWGATAQILKQFLERVREDGSGF